MTEKYKQAYKLTKHQIGGNIRNLRYMTKVAIPGIYNILTHHYGLGRNPSVIKGMKDAMIDFISEEFGGIEPTFVSGEAYDWWENLSDAYFTDKNWQGNETNDLSYLEGYDFNGPLFEDA